MVGISKQLQSEKYQLSDELVEASVFSKVDKGFAVVSLVAFVVIAFLCFAIYKGYEYLEDE